MKQLYTKIVTSTILVAAIIVSVISFASTSSTAQAGSNAIQYRNKVFTKKLYKNTKKITFQGVVIAKDKKSIKKTYKILANIELKPKVINPDEEPKVGFTSVGIFKKNGKIRGFVFRGNEMLTEKKSYYMIKNLPYEKLRALDTYKK